MPGLLSILSSCIGLITIEEPPPSAHTRKRMARKMDARQRNPPKPVASSAPQAAPSPAAAAVPGVERQHVPETQFVYTAQTVQGTQPVHEPQPIPGPQLGCAPQDVIIAVCGLQPVQGPQPGYGSQPVREPNLEQVPQQRPQPVQQPQFVRETQPAQGPRPAREPDVDRKRPTAGEARYAPGNQSARYARAPRGPRSTPPASIPAATQPMSSDGVSTRPMRRHRSSPERNALESHIEDRRRPYSKDQLYEQSEYERPRSDESSDTGSTRAHADYNPRDDYPLPGCYTQLGDYDSLPEDEWPRDIKGPDQHVPYSGGSGPAGMFACPVIQVFPVFTAPLCPGPYPMTPKPTLSSPPYQAPTSSPQGTDFGKSHDHSLHHRPNPMIPKPPQCCSEHRAPKALLLANGGQEDRDQTHHHSIHHQPTMSPDSTPSSWAGSEPVGSPGKSKKKRRSASKIGYIWPKDPRPGNPGRWSRGSRLCDILTGKGPDMYVGRIGVRTREEVTGETPKAQRGTERYRWDSEKYWSLWGHEHELHCKADYCDDCDRIEEQRVRDNRIPQARRGSSERYDFRMRKYREPDVGTWSGVRFCRERSHTVPRVYRDIQGRSYPGNQWHDTVHGAHTD
ncbi:hypothetical protein ASPCAL03515 [Aspergillus calidoustus]|uniref:Uncharacterized protein n=1 Tax=Aspergillus calidoustus TaxID=454130 RepID=A0A0U5FW50_ASPCI|nr:hypothetical protein ASPCAL03515 [Aspergillus calidoustus]